MSRFVKDAYIAGFATAVPVPVSQQKYIEFNFEFMKRKGMKESTMEKVKSISEATGIHTRHFCQPMWLPMSKTPNAKPWCEDIFTPNDYQPPFFKRMQCFQDTAVVLCVEAAKKALANWGGDPSKITHIISTCTSGWSEPGICVSVIRECKLPANCQKAELNFNGCFCGASCLRLAREIIRAGDSTGVLVVACEVASTHFEFTVDESDMSHLVAQALFADGAASIIVAPEGEWRYTKTGMSIVPNSEHLLGLMPPHSPDHTSYKMTLHKDVGQGLINYFSDGVGKELMRGMYDPERPKPALSIHPGGPKILDSMHVVFRNLGWPEDCMAPSYETLQSNGNLGAAAMLFVLSSRLSKPIKEDTMITMAFGPGVTVEWATLEKGPRKKGFDYKAVLKVIQHILVVVGLFYLIQVALEKNGIVIKL